MIAPLRQNNLLSGILCLLLLLIFTCHRKEEILIPKAEDKFIGFQQPAHFPPPVYSFAGNLVTKAKFELGKKLFYDPILSEDNTISCSFCHTQASGFAHADHAVAHGIRDQFGKRNAQPIMNLVWRKTFMHDGGIVDLDTQAISPIQNPIEMNLSLPEAILRLRGSPEYVRLFDQAYTEAEAEQGQKIWSATVLKSIAAFMTLCVSANSKYDSVQRHSATFTAAEAAGYEIFQAQCSVCHRAPLFSDETFRNNGLKPNQYNDKGRYDVTLDPAQQYQFKVPSLRNLKYTPPYFHDGRAQSLGAVLEHYNSGVTDSPTLDPLLKKNGNLGIPLTLIEKQKLIAFLNTLNDPSFIENELLAE